MESTSATLVRLLAEQESGAKWLDPHHVGSKYSDSEWKKVKVISAVLRKCEEVCIQLRGRGERTM